MFIFLFLSAHLALADAPQPPKFLANDSALFQKELAKTAMPVEAWISDLNKTGFDFLCLGETHRLDYRQEYSRVLKNLDFSTLGLEELPTDLEVKLKDYDTTKKYNLLGDEASPLFEAIAGKGVEVRGLEETPAEDLLRLNEMRDKGTNTITRDGFIATHVDELLQKRQRVVAVYGARHCSPFSDGLGFSVPYFHFLRESAPAKKLLSVEIILPSEHNNIVRVFADSFGLTKQDVVLVQPSKIDPKVYNYRIDLETELCRADVILLPKTNLVDSGDNER